MQGFLWKLGLLCILGIARYEVVCAQKDKCSQIQRLVQAKFDWMVRGRWDSLEATLHPAARYIHSNGWAQTRAELLEDLKSQKLVLSSVRILPEKLQCWCHKRTCVVMGEGFFAGAVAGQAFSVPLLFTETYHKINRRWRLLSRQAVKI